MRSRRRWRVSKTRWVLVVGCSLLLFVSPVVQAQPSATPSSNESDASSVSSDGLYFADILVRGRPVFQVGSLADVNASDRAKIINRRIASLLSRGNKIEPVTVNIDATRNIATLKANNRVLMTINEQDAQDFGVEVKALGDLWADKLNRAFNRPPLAIDVGQRLYGTTRDLLSDAIGNLPALLGAIVVVLLTFIVAKIVRYLAYKWAKQTEGDPSTEILIGRLSYGGVWVGGSVIALGVLGLDFGALLGALGLTSVAIGFSLKDVLSNYISGVILLAARPFRINDQVIIGDYEGTIAQIQLRATTLKTYDGRLVYIPNQKVFAASIINNTASPRRRSSVTVGIDYGEDIALAKQTIYAAIKTISAVEQEPHPSIIVTELAASTVNLDVRFWVDSRRSGFLSTTSEVIQAIKEGLDAANIEMPTDIYTLVFRNLSEQIQDSGDGLQRRGVLPKNRLAGKTADSDSIEPPPDVDDFNESGQV
ncbi:mechanosensitive ion channel family protein [Oscillatoria sp. FACHB-1406]|nr:mechanosensitive ion channel family protein [Oscillatoria sp. FACHB-1406]